MLNAPPGPRPPVGALRIHKNQPAPHNTHHRPCRPRACVLFDATDPAEEIFTARDAGPLDTARTDENEDSDADDVVDDDASAFSAQSCPDAIDRDINYKSRHCLASDRGSNDESSNTEVKADGQK